MLGKPLDQEVEPPPATFRADSSAPLRPSPDQVAEAQQSPDLTPGGVIQQPGRCPVAIEATQRFPAFQKGPEALLVDVVVPDIREPMPRPAHESRLILHGITVPSGPSVGLALGSGQIPGLGPPSHGRSASA
jgi:hypothetical protein